MDAYPYALPFRPKAGTVQHWVLRLGGVDVPTTREAAEKFVDAGNAWLYGYGAGNRPPTTVYVLVAAAVVSVEDARQARLMQEVAVGPLTATAGRRSI